MNYYLGIDTSNYTTSVALYCDNGEIIQQRKLLPVKENTCGLRQSDAVFHHTNQMYSLYGELVKNIDCSLIKAVGVSSRPRPVENSYMPCFTVGINPAKIVAGGQLYADPRVEAMPCYPEKGCTRLIDGTLVVKLSQP